MLAFRGYSSSKLLYTMYPRIGCMNAERMTEISFKTNSLCIYDFFFSFFNVKFNNFFHL